MTDVLVLQDDPGLALEGGVALGLDGPDRDVPAVLLGDDGLGVPVGALDQTDGDGKLLGACPGQKVGQILVRVFEVGLQHDAQVRVVAEFVAVAQAAVHFQGDVLELVLLHVDAHEPVHFLHFAQDGGQSVVDAPDRAFEIPGRGLGEKGGGLDRDVDLGRVAPVQGASGQAGP